MPGDGIWRPRLHKINALVDLSLDKKLIRSASNQPDYDPPQQEFDQCGADSVAAAQGSSSLEQSSA